MLRRLPPAPRRVRRPGHAGPRRRAGGHPPHVHARRAAPRRLRPRPPPLTPLDGNRWRQERCRTGMRKLLAACWPSPPGSPSACPSTSSAGGWVVVSLDEVPAVHAGEDTEIGFTVLRHGVTPERADDLAVVVTGPIRVASPLRGRSARAPPGTTSPRSRCPTRASTRWKVTGQFVDAELGHAGRDVASDGGPSGRGTRPVGDARRSPSGWPVSPRSTSPHAPPSPDGTPPPA